MKWIKLNESKKKENSILKGVNPMVMSKGCDMGMDGIHGDGCVVGEGGGAGYTIEVSGIEVASVDEGDDAGDYVEFTATITPSDVEVSAIGYDGTFCDREVVTIQGGVIRGWFFPEDTDVQGVEEWLKRRFDSFESMVGRGWSHVNLQDQQTYEVDEDFGAYGEIHIDTITLDSHEMADVVNTAYEVGYGDDMDEPVNESKVIMGKGSIQYDDDVVSVYTPDGKREWTGLWDDCPYKDDDLEYSSLTKTYKCYNPDSDDDEDYRIIALEVEA